MIWNLTQIQPLYQYWGGIRFCRLVPSQCPISAPPVPDNQSESFLSCISLTHIQIRFTSVPCILRCMQTPILRTHRCIQRKRLPPTGVAYIYHSRWMHCTRNLRHPPVNTQSDLNRSWGIPRVHVRTALSCSRLSQVLPDVDQSLMYTYGPVFCHLEILSRHCRSSLMSYHDVLSRIPCISSSCWS
jgi:hypothetical protein